MSDFWLYPTEESQWYELIQWGRERAHVVVSDEVAHYLLVTVLGFSKDVELGRRTIAFDYLSSVSEAEGREQIMQLRSVGDECLLVSGLFPERISQKHVDWNYYISIGQSAYHIVGELRGTREIDPELFYALSTHFVGLTDILHAVRRTR